MIEDVRHRRGADIASDHQLIVANMNLENHWTIRETALQRKYETTIWWYEGKLAGTYGKPEIAVKNKQDKPITEIQEQRNRWVEHYEELLQRPASSNPPDIEAAYTDPLLAVTTITIEEIRMFIRQIKRGKVTGPDKILAEALKSDVKAAIIAAACAAVGLNIHKGKSWIIKYNTENTNPITLDGETGRCGIIHVPRKHHQETWIIRSRRKGKDWQSKDSISTVEGHIEFKTNVKQCQRQNHQYEHQDSSIVWSGNLEGYQNHHQKSTSIYKQLFTQYTQCPLTGYCQQKTTAEENEPTNSQ
ncbi:unnamed protein product [Schistosoma margrebowiei]|uniref:Uncharacterized protein n=1 Tax=Schistosoma margrebowiei TaxID=48269 RepID=A0A183LQR1_9TREM|nr:unnamed protein product [Schistosoma margrebowiei]